MSKDRARPFSRKHRRYWIPVTGGMILIGTLNVTIGYCSYDPPGDPPEKIQYDLTEFKKKDAGIEAVDAAVPAVPTAIASPGSAGARSDAERRGVSIDAAVAK